MLAIVLLGINPAGAVTILEGPTVTDVIPGVTQFSTYGDMMDGLMVTAVFGSGIFRDPGLGRYRSRVWWCFWRRLEPHAVGRYV